VDKLNLELQGSNFKTQNQKNPIKTEIEHNNLKLILSTVRPNRKSQKNCYFVIAAVVATRSPFGKSTSPFGRASAITTVKDSDENTFENQEPKVPNETNKLLLVVATGSPFGRAAALTTVGTVTKIPSFHCFSQTTHLGLWRVWILLDFRPSKPQGLELMSATAARGLKSYLWGIRYIVQCFLIPDP